MYLSVYLSVYLQAWKRRYSARRPRNLDVETWKTKLFRETSSIIWLENIENEAFLRDFFNHLTWRHRKRSDSARLPSRHNSVQCVICHLARWLRTRRLASLFFDPAEPQNIGKHSVSWLFHLSKHLHLPSSNSFSSLTLSLRWLFPPLLFHLSTLSEVCLLNFLRLS